jgi:hypothetical protein
MFDLTKTGNLGTDPSGLKETDTFEDNQIALVCRKNVLINISFLRSS